MIFVLISVFFIACSGNSSDKNISNVDKSTKYLSPPQLGIDNPLVPITQEFVLEFSAIMDPSSFSNETLFIKDANGEIISTSFKQDGDYKVIITPSVYLKMGSNYTLNVGTGVRDTDERSLSVPYSSSFTTQNSGGDTSAPTLVRKKPYSANKDSAAVENSEPVDISTRIAMPWGA